MNVFWMRIYGGTRLQGYCALRPADNSSNALEPVAAQSLLQNTQLSLVFGGENVLDYNYRRYPYLLAFEKFNMKTAILTLLIALSAAAATQAVPIDFLAAPIDSLVINEINGTLDVTLNGVEVTGSPLASTGPTDHWVETLSGFSFNMNVNGTFKLGEPENALQKNEISGFNALGHFEWRSDIAKSKMDGTFPFSITILDAGTDPSGNAFNLTLTDTSDAASVPDTGTTAMLLGCALSGLGVMRRWMRCYAQPELSRANGG